MARCVCQLVLSEAEGFRHPGSKMYTKNIKKGPIGLKEYSYCDNSRLAQKKWFDKGLIFYGRGDTFVEQ